MKRALLAVCLAAALAAPVHAGLFDDEEARQRTEKLRKDFDELAKRVDLASQNQIDFANQTEMLKSDVARLRGQIEVILYDLDQTQKRQKDFYVDLDTRLRKLETPVEAPKADAAGDTATAPKAAAVDPANETRDYEAALTAFKGVKYKDALAAFQAFIKNYPQSTLQASAHYWAASSNYQLKNYPLAAELFGAVATKWPNDAKAPDALLAQANAQIEAGDAKAARKTLETLVEKYPTATATPSAKARLKSLTGAAPRKK